MISGDSEAVVQQLAERKTVRIPAPDQEGRA
jgi:hypothetical protein